MQKFIDLLETKLMPIANKISTQRHIKEIRDTFMTILPILFFGGMVAVLNANPATEETTNGFLLAWSAFDAKFAVQLSWLNLVTMGFLALYVCIGITYYLCVGYKMNVFAPILTSIAGFMMLAGDAISLGYGDAQVQVTYFDGKGILVAIVVAILTVELYRFLRNKNVGRIKLPDSVPGALTESFASLVPILIVLLADTILFFIFNTLGTTMAKWILAMLSPALEATDSLWFAMLVGFLLNFGWFFGVHDTVFSGFLSPIEYGNLANNAAAFAAGTALPNVFTVSFWAYFGIIGGLGNCLALGILCLLSKSKEFKTVGRLGIAPAFFGISEPITFGLPIMLNPILFIPSIVTSMVNCAVTFLLMSGGVIGRTYAMLSYNMPSIFGSFLSTGDFKAAVLIVVLILVDMAIYYPFFKAYERSTMKAEKAE